MGSGTAKSVRLELGVELRKRVHARQGTDEDVALVLEGAPDFMDDVAKQLIERAKIIRDDRDCFRLTDDVVVIKIPALKRPTLAKLQKDWGNIREIERDDSTEEAVTLRFATVLASTAQLIDGATYEHRLAKLRADGNLLGFQHRNWLVAHQDDEKAIPDPHVCAALKAFFGKVYVDFPGLVVVVVDGNRCMPFVRDVGRQWIGYWRWLAHGFLGRDRLAVSSK